MFNFIRKLFSAKTAPTMAAWCAVALKPAQAKRHAHWVAQQVYLNWLGPYFKAYHLRKGGAGGQRGLRVQLLQESGRQGALFFYEPSIGPGNFRHLFEFLGEQLLAQGYRRACADQHTQRHARHAETTLKQLFKPTPTDCPRTGHCNQRYGLVTVDLATVDGQPQFIRIASNAVLQPGFTPAYPFDELMQTLFDAPAADGPTQAAATQYRTAF